MKSPMKLAAIGVVALALAACSGTSSSVPNPQGLMPQQQQMSHVINSVPGLDLTKVHIYPVLGHQVGVIPNAPQTLTYRNGKVLTPPHVYVVFWHFGGGGDPAGEQKYMTAFLNGVGGSKWEGLLKQYYQIVGSKKTFITNPTKQLVKTWVDGSSEPSAPSDAQIQAEATRLVAHFGYNANDSYVVATSHAHNTPGFGTSFCAYHGAYSDGGKTVSYSNIPYIHDAGASCGENFVNGGSKGSLDGVSIVEGHEYAESITDPSPPSGWYNNSYGEIGDICAWMKPPAGNITLSTGTFAVQGLWSNKHSDCSITG